MQYLGLHGLLSKSVDGVAGALVSGAEHLHVLGWVQVGRPWSGWHRRRVRDDGGVILLHDTHQECLPSL